jgi:hypothetical protein
MCHNKIEYDIKDKTAAANQCFHTLNKMLSKRYIRASKKTGTYKTVITPITLHSSETWNLTEDGIHSDDMKRKDFMENLQMKM